MIPEFLFFIEYEMPIMVPDFKVEIWEYTSGGHFVDGYRLVIGQNVYEKAYHGNEACQKLIMDDCMEIMQYAREQGTLRVN